MVDVDTFLTTLSVIVDDFCQSVYRFHRITWWTDRPAMFGAASLRILRSWALLTENAFGGLMTG